MIGAITPQTRMLLANAVYFKAAWLHPFDPLQTFGETFFTGDGGRSMNNIPMMHGSDLYQGGIFDDLDAKAIFMPYEVPGRVLAGNLKFLQCRHSFVRL